MESEKKKTGFKLPSKRAGREERRARKKKTEIWRFNKRLLLAFVFCLLFLPPPALFSPLLPLSPFLSHSLSLSLLSPLFFLSRCSSCAFLVFSLYYCKGSLSTIVFFSLSLSLSLSLFSPLFVCFCFSSFSCLASSSSSSSSSSFLLLLLHILYPNSYELICFVCCCTVVFFFRLCFFRGIWSSHCVLVSLFVVWVLQHFFFLCCCVFWFWLLLKKSVLL